MLAMPHSGSLMRASPLLQHSSTDASQAETCSSWRASRRMGMHERLPKLKRFPVLLPSANLVRIELQEGIPMLKATRAVQKRTELLSGA